VRPRAVKTKWTPEAEQRAAEMWNANAPTEKIVLVLKKDFGVVVNAEGIHSLAKRRGSALGMIEGSDRRRAPRPDRVKPPKALSLKKPPRKMAPQPDVIDGTPFADLRRGQCRFALTSSLPHLFCRCDAMAGQSWCEKHSEIVMPKKGQKR